MLPGGKVLTVDAYVNRFDPNGKNSELYDPSTGSWSSIGSTIVQLWDSHGSYEVGPAVLRPDGTVFATGANGAGAGHTSIYNVSAGTWTAGPDFPNGLDIADGPAALLPDGNVLMMTSPGIYQQRRRLLRVGWNQAEPGSRRAQQLAGFVLVRTHAGPSDRTNPLHRLQQ